MADAGVLIVGAGQAACHLAGYLRDEGYPGPVRVLGDEPHLPYQRPPLSKAYLGGACEAGALTFHDHEHYAGRGIELTLATRVTRVDRAERAVLTADGGRHPYRQLVFATGARNRSLVADTPGVLGLRTLDDAARLRKRLAGTEKAVVVGAGFLGLEFAAVAAARGVDVTVVEAAGSLMARAVSPVVGEAFRAHHEENGVTFRIGSTVDSIEPLPGGQCRVVVDSEPAEAGLVVSSIGVEPNAELARDAGLPVRNGIVVDERLRTEDPAISAIGDCAAFVRPSGAGRGRIESVQNAVDQARYLAGSIAGRAGAYDAVPWFWSDQGGLKLQIAGLSGEADEIVLRGDVAARRFSAFRFRAGELTAVESVARPADHMAARRLLAAGVHVTPEQAADDCFELKSLLAKA
ncbi:pyridine nucleotide-disulfide oxidoreductase [Amycolatopsis acidicola]|uniref:Pyridine nucleotide-disulfide oxidoreductase n=1 Tax=Amycolatopsis acidicola TaxID=2596893 RepID=A0A5N0VIF2_9PSEU|nr:FAD-dependent oxidoreductase [Amycolatopsis acidicola]KAA9164452.1 pyridine nucleotide-disulfide oxidoreductase [Amycolatopsis acidicola]